MYINCFQRKNCLNGPALILNFFIDDPYVGSDYEIYYGHSLNHRIGRNFSFRRSTKFVVTLPELINSENHISFTTPVNHSIAKDCSSEAN